MVLLGFHVCFFIWILAKRKDSTATIWNLATAGTLSIFLHLDYAELIN